MEKTQLDSIDRRILALLQDNARISNAEVARRVGMAPSAVLERIRKLERRKLILGYEAKVNAAAMGLGLTAFIFVRTEEPVGSTGAGAVLAELPEVMEVHHTAGQDCYLLKVKAADTGALAQLLKRIGKIETVSDTRTTIVLTTIKETLKSPLELD